MATLTESIKTQPYFRVTNCKDVADLKYGINQVHELEEKFGRRKTLDKIFNRLFKKARKLGAFSLKNLGND